MPASKVPMFFYRSAMGAEPVRAWLLEMTPADRQIIGMDLMRAQFAWPVGMPLCRPLGDGLFEIRVNLPGHRIARVFVCFCGGALYALHGFIKKTQKAPLDDLRLARQRKKDVEHGKE